LQDQLFQKGIDFNTCGGHVLKDLGLPSI